MTITQAVIVGLILVIVASLTLKTIKLALKGIAVAIVIYSLYHIFTYLLA